MSEARLAMTEAQVKLSRHTNDEAGNGINSELIAIGNDMNDLRDAIARLREGLAPVTHSRDDKNARAKIGFIHSDGESAILTTIIDMRAAIREAVQDIDEARSRLEI